MKGEIMVGDIPYSFQFEISINIQIDTVYYVNGSIVSWVQNGVYGESLDGYYRGEIESYVRSGSWVIIDKSIGPKKCIKKFKI